MRNTSKFVGATGRSPVHSGGSPHNGRSPLRSSRLPHHRRSIRMKGFNYTNSGAYFVTICANNRECLFGHAEDGTMALNEFGIIIREEWEKSADIRREITLETFAIMPNHIHGIIIIQNTDPTTIARATGKNARATGKNARATGRSPLQHGIANAPTPNRPCGPTKKSLGAFIAGFKSSTTKRVNQLRKSPGKPVWQRNYYEHIIRDENELNRIHQYIMNNPLNWMADLENPQNPEKSSGAQL